ncbi:MAG: beta-lactamase family protein [Arenicellales bacterium]|nr:beta-lactamase family protein [Arenicellales bacterium]
MCTSKSLTERIPAILKAGRVPGLSIALIKDCQVIWERGFGVRKTGVGAPVTTETVFEAASLTKPLFAYLVLLAVDRQILELDVPLVTYVDRETIETEVTQHSLDVEGFRCDWFERITARHVLSHSSGMPHTERGVPFPLFFEPGLEFKYSATGYYFLQLVIEKLKGEPLERIAESEIFRPLSMERSSLVWLERFGADAADGHDILSRPQEIRKYQRAHAAASMYTTAGDYARFVATVLGGEGLTESSKREMYTPQIPMQGDDSWGLGFGIQRDGTGDALWQWGDYGIFRNFVIAYPDRGMAVVYLTNSPNGLGIRDEIVRTALGSAVTTSESLARYPAYDSPALQFAWIVLEGDTQTALRKLPSLRESGKPLDGKVLNALGYLLIEEERIEDAIAVFELNVVENPRSANTYYGLAGAYRRRNDQGDRERALANYRKALKASPGDTSEDTDFLDQIRKDAKASILKLENEKRDNE